MLEVYPHAALLELFQLPCIIKYKKGNVTRKRRGQQDLQHRLKELSLFSPPLESTPKLSEHLSIDTNSPCARRAKGGSFMHFRAQPKSSLGKVVVLVFLACLSISLQSAVARAQAQPQTEAQKKQEALKNCMPNCTPQQLEDAIEASEASGRRPQVAWYVLPSKIIRDNYGHYVSSKYIAIDITVHNMNSTDQISVQAFTFLGLRSDDPYKNSDPNLVRGSIVKGQETGARNTLVRVIKVVGNLATGAGGFVKNAGASASYGRGVSIFSDPFEKGVELIIPDTTVTYLTAWDKDEVFKKGFIVEPGKEVTGRIFIPVSLVCELLRAHQPPVNTACKEGGWLRSAQYDPLVIRDNLAPLGVMGSHITLTVKRPITRVTELPNQ